MVSTWVLYIKNTKDSFIKYELLLIDIFKNNLIILQRKQMKYIADSLYCIYYTVDFDYLYQAIIFWSSNIKAVLHT